MMDMTVADAGATIDQLEKDGVILGYGAIVNWSKVPERNVVSAYIELKVTPQRHNGFNRLAQRIYQYPQVKCLNLMSGSYDFGITVEGESIKDISLFVSEHLAPMEGVLSTATHFVLKIYKEGGTVFVTESEDDREVMRDEYDNRRKIIVKVSNDMGLDHFEAQGAFYAFLSIKSTGLSSNDFCEKLLYDMKVAVIPGNAFGDCGEGHIRCSYAYSLDSINEALNRIETFIKKLK